MTRPDTGRNPLASQAGGGMLTVVAVLGMILMLAQGTMYYRAKGSAKLLSREKNKVLALQMAEAGVEENIAEIAKRKTRVRAGLTDTVTHDNRTLGGGSYTSWLTTVAVGPGADTVDLASMGRVGTGTQTVHARMRLKKYLDTTRTVVLFVKPETTLTLVNHVVPETTIVPPMDPAAMPNLNTTPAYAACMASSDKKCNICHLPSMDLSKANVLDVAKPSIGTHISHHGDYVTTDGTCDLYRTRKNITTRTILDTLRAITDLTRYDTTVAIDTSVKVQVLSWK